MDYQISDKMKTIKASAIREILKYASHPGVISLGAGDPAPESLPVEKLQRIMGNILNENPTKALLYSQSEGHPPLREKVKEYVKEMYQIDTTNDEAMIISGAQQCMDLVTKVLCNEGDTVICEDPSFIGSLNCFRSYGANLVGVPMESDGIHIEKLEAALKANPNTKLIYLIPNFQNPTGITMSFEKRKAVYELAKKYQVVILEDNPYGDLRFEGEHIPAIKTLDTEGLVVYAGTFSKILSSGIRIGYMIAPKGLFGKLTVAKQCVDVHTTMLGQLLCLNFLEQEDMQTHLDGLRVIYKEKYQLMADTVDQTFPATVTRTSPEGGLFLWCTMPPHMDSEEVASRIVQEQKVCIVPGSAFMATEGTPSNSFRMSFSMPSKENIATGVGLVGEFLQKNL